MLQGSLLPPPDLVSLETRLSRRDCAFAVSNVGCQLVPAVVSGPTRLTPRRRQLSALVRRGALALAAFAAGACTVIPKAPGDAVFRSPDGRREARVVQGAVVVDGLANATRFDGISKLGVKFGADGRRLAYVSVRGEQLSLVVDGKEFGPFDNVGRNFSFSPSGRRIAAHVQSSGAWRIWVDGVAGSGFDDLLADPPAYTADETQFAYAAKRGNRWVVVAGAQECEAGDGTVGESPGYLSSGELYFAWIAGKQARVRVGDALGDPVNAVAVPGVRRSSDGRAVTYAVIGPAGLSHCVNTTCRGTFKNVGTPLRSREGFFGPSFWGSILLGAVGAAAGGMSGAMAAPVMPPGMQTFFYTSTVFSPDGAHYAYFAFDGERRILVDAVPVASVDSKVHFDLFFRLRDAYSKLSFGSTGNAEMFGYMVDQQRREVVWSNKVVAQAGAGGLVGMMLKGLMTSQAISQANQNLVHSIPPRVETR